MKKLIIYLSVLAVIILLSTSCKKHNLEKHLYGKWSASIDLYHPIDTECICNYDEVIIEFKKNNVAYLNYNGPNGFRWSTPYKCKWFLKKETIRDYNKDWRLYILRYDTLAYPCHSSSGNCWTDMEANSKTLVFPDTAIYDYCFLDENSNSMELSGVQIKMDDMFFPNIHYLYTIYQRFHRIN